MPEYGPFRPTTLQVVQQDGPGWTWSSPATVLLSADGAAASCPSGKVVLEDDGGGGTLWSTVAVSPNTLRMSGLNVVGIPNNYVISAVRVVLRRAENPATGMDGRITCRERAVGFGAGASVRSIALGDNGLPRTYTDRTVAGDAGVWGGSFIPASQLGSAFVEYTVVGSGGPIYDAPSNPIGTAFLDMVEVYITASEPLGDPVGAEMVFAGRRSPFEYGAPDIPEMSEIEPSAEDDPVDFYLGTETARNELAARVVRWVDTAENDRESKFRIYQIAQDCYDNVQAPSNLDFGDDDDAPTVYNLSMMDQRIDNIVAGVAGMFDSSSPRFVLTGGEDDASREATEQTVDVALTDAEIGIQAREITRNALIWGHGPFRVAFRSTGEEVKADDIAAGTVSELPFAGVEFEPIHPPDFYFYPVQIKTLNEARLVGHREHFMWSDVVARIRSGEWNGDMPTGPGTSDPEYAASSSSEASDQFVEVVCAIVSIPAPEPEGSSAEDDDAAPEPASVAADRMFEVWVDRGGRKLLHAEPYDLPTPRYFVAKIQRSPTILPSVTVGTRLIDSQAAYNDAGTGWVATAARSPWPTVLMSGVSTDQQDIKLKMDSVLPVEGNPSFTVVPQGQVGAEVPALMDKLERLSDGSARTSQMNSGQALNKNATATEAAALAQGAAGGIVEYRQVLGSEFCRAVHLVRIYLARNWESFKRYQGRRVQLEDPMPLLATYGVEPNGKRPDSSPQTTIEQVRLAVEIAAQLQIPIDNVALFRAAVGALQLPMNVDKLMLQQVEQPTNEPSEIGPDSNVGAPGGAAAQIPADLLAAMAAGLGGGGSGAVAPGPPELAGEFGAFPVGF